MQNSDNLYVYENANKSIKPLIARSEFTAENTKLGA